MFTQNTPSFWLRTIMLIGGAVAGQATVFALNYSGGTYSQSFDTLAGTTNNLSSVAWSNDSTLPGWHASRTNYAVTDATLGGSAAAFNVTDVAANVGLLSFGTAGSTDRALGSRATSSVTAGTGANPVLFGIALANTTGGSITGFNVSYTGEQWHQADATAVQVLNFEYKLDATALDDAAGWVAASGGTSSATRTGTTPTALDGNAVANRTLRTVTVAGISWAPGTTLWIRFRDANDSGSEHGLAVDDFNFDTTLPAPVIVTGPWSGNVSPGTATVSTSIDQAGVSVRAVASLAADFTGPLITSTTVTTQSTDGFAARLNFTGLAIDTTYYYALELDGVRNTNPSKTGRFRTFPLPGPATYSIAFSACGHWTEAKQFVYDAIGAEDIRLFLHVGDFNYSDTNSTNPDLYRNNYRDALSIGNQGNLFRRFASAYVWDDHDFAGNDSDRTFAGRLASRQVYRERVPHYPLPDVPVGADTYGAIYHTFTLGRVRYIVTDLRSQRDPVSQTDDASKSIMGAAQKAWFKQQLLAARDAETPLIAWVSPVPFLATSTSEDDLEELRERRGLWKAYLATSTSSDDWGRYTTERTELLTFIRDQQIQNIVILSGDMHALAIDDGRGTANYVAGVRIPVFHGAALTRNGSVKGGPYSHGTSPGSGRYALLTVNDDGIAPISVTYQGKIATSAADTSVWNSLTHVTEPVRPRAPSALSISPAATGLALLWADLSSTETGYRIERAPASTGPWVTLATTAANATFYTDTTAAPGVTYHYRLVAVNSTIEAAPTATASAVAPGSLAR